MRVLAFLPNVRLLEVRTRCFENSDYTYIWTSPEVLPQLLFQHIFTKYGNYFQ